VHIRFYDRGVDAKSTAVRDPGTLGDFDDLSVQLLDHLWSERTGDLQNRLGIGHIAGIDPRECPIDQVGADLVLQIVVTSVGQMLQDQHPDDDLRRRARTAAAPTLRPPSFEALSDDLNHGFVLEQRVDLGQPLGAQPVAIGQQNFEQTPFALSSLNHARSFDQKSRAGNVVRQIDRRNSRIECLVMAGRRPSVQFSDLRGHFFTAKYLAP